MAQMLKHKLQSLTLLWGFSSREIQLFFLGYINESELKEVEFDFCVF